MVLDYARVGCPGWRDALNCPPRNPLAPVKERGSMPRILEGLGDGNLREHLGEEVRVDLRPAWNPAKRLVIATKDPTPAPAWCRFTFGELRPWVRPAWHRGHI